MPITRSAADAFPYTEESSNPDSQSFATFESERTDIDDDESFVPATQDGSGDELEFFDLEDLETVDEEDFDEVDGEETEGELNDGADGEEAVQIELSLDPNYARTGGSGIGHVRVIQPEGRASPITVTREQILALFGQGRLREIIQRQGFRTAVESLGNEESEASDEDEVSYAFGRPRRRRGRDATNNFNLPPVPSPAGQGLMDSGTFGINSNWQDTLRSRKKLMARILMTRELGLNTEQVQRANQEIAQNMIPPFSAEMIIHYKARCYSGQFSNDGNFFFSCAQDYKVRMYDTSNPYEWKYYRTVHHPYGQWTITDATLSPDNKFLACSTMRSTVCLAITDPTNDADPYLLNFADLGGSRRSQRPFHSSANFGIWSLRFSGDGREIVAGTSDNSVYVYDIETNCSILRIHGHTEDVNAVCFGDTSSPHILYSGSDDTLIKVWDRRSMSDSREAGVFMGHTEGLTYVDSKGDGRYVLSNGKDQSMKLWDLRKMMSTEASAQINPMAYTSGFDYRWMNYADTNFQPHPHDCSVVTYRGHSVLKTLIRCHFSPPNSTNSRYVFSGSENGKIHVYNMDATIAGIIDVGEATYESRPRNRSGSMDSRDGDISSDGWEKCVRDASWHPNAPIIAATSWSGYGMSSGTCSIHSWNEGTEDDESGISMGRRVNHQLEPQRQSLNNPNRMSMPRRRGLRSQAVNRQGGEDEEARIW